MVILVGDPLAADSQFANYPIVPVLRNILLHAGMLNR